MTNLDIEQIEKFIITMSEKVIEGRCDYDDIRNMLQTIISLNAEIKKLKGVACD